MAEREPALTLRETVENRQVSYEVANLGPNDYAEFSVPAHSKAYFGVKTVDSGSFVSGDLQLYDVTDPSNPTTFADSIDGEYHAPTTALVLGHLNHPIKQLRMVNVGSATLTGKIHFLR